MTTIWGMAKQGYHSKICSAAAVYPDIRAIPGIYSENTIEQKWPHLLRSKVHLSASCLWQWLIMNNQRIKREEEYNNISCNRPALHVCDLGISLGCSSIFALHSSWGFTLSQNYFFTSVGLPTRLENRRVNKKIRSCFSPEFSVGTWSCKTYFKLGFASLVLA